MTLQTRHTALAATKPRVVNARNSPFSRGGSDVQKGLDFDCPALRS